MSKIKNRETMERALAKRFPGIEVAILPENCRNGDNPDTVELSLETTFGIPEKILGKIYSSPIADYWEGSYINGRLKKFIESKGWDFDWWSPAVLVLYFDE